MKAVAPRLTAAAAWGSVLVHSVTVILPFGYAQGSAPQPSERTVEITYWFAVRDVPADAKRVAAWVPIPPKSRLQRLTRLRIQGKVPCRFLADPEYGNRFLCFDLSSQQTGLAEKAVTVLFRVTRKSYPLSTAEAGIEPTSRAALSRFLAPDRLVPVDGKIAEEARRVAGEEQEPLARARRLYDHIVKTMTYDKSGQGWGCGDALYACDKRAGNCTDFHSLFIGEARSLNIPARFVMGLPLPEGKAEGLIPGYHCWAEFYIEGRGWIPVDASEASQHREKQEDYFGGLDANRVAFTVGRDLHIPDASVGPLNYAIYPYVEVDGRSYDKVETRFSFKEETPAR